MCSRYNLTLPPEAVRAFFSLASIPDFPPRYNIAPSQPVLIVRAGRHASPEPLLVRWGLIPSWVKEPREHATLINARAETAAEKPSFRGGMRHRRCLVPATGFYEWSGRPGAKTPYLIRPRGGGLMALAAIYEHWLGADGSEVDTMAVLTIAANETVRPVHDRMPVIVAPADFPRWLDCRPGTALKTADLLQPAPSGLLEAIALSPRVGNPRNEGPDLLTRPDGTRV